MHCSVGNAGQRLLFVASAGVGCCRGRRRGRQPDMNCHILLIWDRQTEASKLAASDGTHVNVDDGVGVGVDGVDDGVDDGVVVE